MQVTTPSGTSSTGSGDRFTYTAAAGPVVSGLTPATGSTAGGDTVVVLGSAFTAASNVTVGGVAVADFTVLSDDAIALTTPMLPAGTFDVRVTTPGGTSAAVAADEYTYTNVTGPAPAVSGVSPATGSTAGGQVVSITGTGFTGATGVSFGGTAAGGYSILSDSLIEAVAPAAGSAGSVDVQVTTNNGTSATVSADQFTYVALGAPTVGGLGTGSGSTAGGTSVSITGTNFTPASQVFFGGVPAASVSYPSGTSLSAVSPAGYAGAVDVTVTTASGTSATSGSDQFTYTAAAAPTIGSLGTTSGTTAGGTSVTINGSNLAGAVGVTFGGVGAVSFTIVSGTQITAVTPANIAGVIDVVVTTTAGSSTPSSNSRFTFSAASPPAVSGLGTSSGTTGGGTSVVLTGTDFTGATDVTFGGVSAASFTVDSATQITAVSPPMAAGTAAVVVWTPTGSSQVGSACEYAYTAAAAPAVTGLGTSSGGTAGGTVVAITGTGFTGASTVLFGGVPAAFTVNSDTSITATAPGQAAGTVDVTVTTPSGASATSGGDLYTYTAAPAPVVGGLSSTSGGAAGGTTVVVYGSGFTGATGVTFGGVAAEFSVLSDTALEATAPGGTGTVDVQVTTPSGTSAASSADHFSYAGVTAPTVTGLSATSGTTGGGTTLTLSGTGFLNADAVTIGGQDAAFVVLSATSLAVTTPPMAAGTYDLVVGVPGASSAPARFTYAAAGAPAVSSLGTTGGSTAGGTSVGITGTGFTGAGTVLFGTVPAASFTVNSDTSITAVAPAAAAAGVVGVTVQTPTGVSAAWSGDQFTYTAASAPTLGGLSLTSGSTAGGATVNLTGSGFTGATAVSFGSAGASFTVQSDGWVTAVVPAGSAGTVSVTVTTAGGTSGGISYTYSAPAGPAVTGLTATTGGTAGGGTTTVLGSGFTAATGVSFGTAAAGSFTVLSDTAIQVVVPAGSAGTVDVTVTTAAGTSATGSADHFTYTAAGAPAVTGVSASSGSGSGGETVTISGTNLAGATAVQFGAAAATFVVNSPTQITAVAPAAAAGTVDVTVTTAAGTSATGSADHFTYTAAGSPVVSGVSASAGPLGGGNGVLIAGSGFGGAGAVSFGSAPAASFTVLSATAIFATAPAGSAGTVGVTVTTPAGTSAASASDQYTYLAAPTLSGLSVTTDDASGGAPVVLTGMNLGDPTAVHFGATPAADFWVTGSGQVTAVAPANAVGAVAVSVETPGGESGGLTFTYTAATVVSWVGGNGNGATAADWGGGAVPAPGDDVVIPAGVTVTVSSGLDSPHDLTVNGTLDVTGGELSVGGSGTAATVALGGGTLGVAGLLTVGSGLTWTGGTLGGGWVTVAGGAAATLNASGGTLTLGNGTTLTNDGTAGFSSGATLGGSGGGATFVNDGVVSVSSGQTVSVASSVAFTNAGTVDVAGTLSLAAGSSSGTVGVSSGGMLDFAGSYTLGATSTVSGAGSVEVGGGSFGSGNVTLGGTLSASGGLSIALGSTAGGTGTVSTSVTNDGTLRVGGAASPGVLAIAGNYTQGISGTLAQVIAGTAAGSGYSQLQVSGTASLAGTLALSTAGGYTPAAGTAYMLLTFGSYSGTFATVSWTTSATGAYNPTNFTETTDSGGGSGPGTGGVGKADLPAAGEDEGPLDVGPRDRDERAVVSAWEGWRRAVDAPGGEPTAEEQSSDLVFTAAAGPGDEWVEGVWEALEGLWEMLA